MFKDMMMIISPMGLFTFYGGSKGGGSSTQTVKNEPSAEVKPFLNPFMQRASDLSNQPYQAYQGQQIAGLDQNQQMGNDLTTNQALNGFQGQNEAGNFYQNLMSGSFADPASNPYLKKNADYAMSGITDAYRTGTAAQNDANFARNGAFGGSAWQQMTQGNEKTLADSLGNAANQFYGQNYNSNMNNMMQGLGLAPTMQNLGYTDAQKLTQVGDANRQYEQDLLNQGLQNWNDYQNAPYKSLDVLGNAIRATMGAGGSSTSTSSGGYKPSPFAGALGGGLAGFGVGGPVGAGIGALGGLLLDSMKQAAKYHVI